MDWLYTLGMCWEALFVFQFILLYLKTFKDFFSMNYVRKAFLIWKLSGNWRKSSEVLKAFRIEYAKPFD